MTSLNKNKVLIRNKTIVTVLNKNRERWSHIFKMEFQ